MKLSHERFFQVIASLQSGQGNGGVSVEREQRRQPRVGMRASVLVAPLDDGGAMGASYAVRLADLSSAGVSFQHFRGLRRGSEFILDLPEVSSPEDAPEPTGFSEPSQSAARILCRVIHTRSAGEHQYVIGAQFVRLWTTPVPTLDSARAA